jgi:radical SAM superfamily enzyme YgiQ (UPF0313 family)
MRCRSLENLLTQAKQGLKYRKRLGLVGAAVSDHPRIEELLLKLGQMGAELSMSSLRMAPLSRIVLRELAKGEARTIALAPEAGSNRLRRLIKKGISEEDVLEAMDKVAEQGIKQVKLYFMIGLPWETDEDIEEIIRLTLKCKDILDKQPSGCRLALNISPFVPKAGTPFQWLPMTAPSILNQRLFLLKNRLMPKGIKLNSESPIWSQVQGVLSRGDEKIAEVLANIGEVSLSGWRKAAEKLDIDYYVNQRWDTKQKLPWAMIDSGIKLEHLKSELERALTSAG